MNNEQKATDSENELDSLGFIEDAKFDFKDYGIEDYFVFVVFWLLAVVVFAQFFSRYILNDSIAWTEEIARYLLVAVAFLGGSMAVRKNSHIRVEFGYRYFPPVLSKILSTFVDALRVVFFLYATFLTYQVIGLMQSQYMTAINVSMAALYWVVLVGFIMMSLRSIQILVKHWQQGYSDLNNKEI